MKQKAGKKTDELLISVLIASPTIRAAAKELEMSESQLYSRIKEPEFNSKYAEARLALLSQTTAYAQGLLSQAVETARAIMNNHQTASQVRLNAADLILRHAYRMSEETEIIQRLERLEQLAKEQKPQQ